MPQEITKKDYNLKLPDQSDICEIIEDQIEHYSYICDAISEQADGCVDIYNADLWNTAHSFQEWTEEAIDSGVCDTGAMGGTDLIKIFQAGQYQYYTQMAYDNQDAIFFNIFVNLYKDLSEDDLALLEDQEVEEKFEEWAEEIDNNDGGEIFKEKLDEWIEELREEAEEKEKFEVDEITEHRMRRAGKWRE